MNRIIALITAAVICLCFAACGSSEAYGTGQQEKSDSAVVLQLKGKITVKENCVAIIRIQMNPAIDIYLDKDNYVLAVEGINEDAQQLLAGINVIGWNGMDAIVELVSAVFTGGFIKEDIIIYVTPVYEEGNVQAGELIKDIPSVLSEMQFRFEVSVVMDEDGIVEENSIDPNKDTRSNESVPTEQTELLSSGRTEVSKDDEGNTHTLYFDENGCLTKEIVEFGNGDRVETVLDINGYPVEEIIVFANGDYQETKFMNGFPSKGIFTGADGTVAETTYDSNGIAVLTIESRSDGVTVERTYYSNGEPQKVTEKYPDGAYNIQTFDENGIKLSQEDAYVRYDGVLTWGKTLYDANGNVTEYYGRDNFDRPIHTVYYGDGSSTMEITESDGSIRIVNRDANGNEIYP